MTREQASGWGLRMIATPPTSNILYVICIFPLILGEMFHFDLKAYFSIAWFNHQQLRGQGRINLHHFASGLILAAAESISKPQVPWRITKPQGDHLSKLGGWKIFYAMGFTHPPVFPNIAVAKKNGGPGLRRSTAGLVHVVCSPRAFLGK